MTGTCFVFTQTAGISKSCALMFYCRINLLQFLKYFVTLCFPETQLAVAFSSRYFYFLLPFIAEPQSLIFSIIHALFISLHLNGPLVLMFGKMNISFNKR